jgi:fermentation-respiration switch protein FrsA (DUF1100 family)
MKKLIILFGLLTSSFTAMGQDMSNGAENFYKSYKLIAQKVTFKNRYQMKVVGNLFIPKDMNQNAKNPAIIVGHPMGAVKEQSAVLYAQKLAEQGFVTLSLDLSFWGESEGQPRNAVLPDVYAEDFSAAVDFLGTRPFVDRERIGVLGICGSGSFVISAAKLDPRMKAIATVSMYDMGAANRNGLHHSLTVQQRKEIIAAAAEKNIKFINFYPFNDIETISPRPMLFIAGENAHSREFSEEAYRLAGQPKELFIVPGAGHVDLYDRVNLIPFDKLTKFFRDNLKYDESITSR